MAETVTVNMKRGESGGVVVKGIKQQDVSRYKQAGYVIISDDELAALEKPVAKKTTAKKSSAE